MKILIVSDIHGNFLGMKKIIEDNQDFDQLFLLGDIFSNNPSSFNDLVTLLNTYNRKILAVRGNNDYLDYETLEFALRDDYLVIPVEGKIFLLTHGHIYHENSFDNIDYDVYIQGHTHVARMDKENDKLYLNPGSIMYPRGGGSRSYILYEDGVFYLKELDSGGVIKKIELVN